MLTFQDETSSQTMDLEVGGDSQMEQMDSEIAEKDADQTIGDETEPTKKHPQHEVGRVEGASEKDTEEEKVEVGNGHKADDSKTAGGEASKTEEEKMEEGGNKEQGERVEDVGAEKPQSAEHEVKCDESMKEGSGGEAAEDHAKKDQADTELDETDGDAEEEKKGSLDQSVIVEGKRKRHTVERMVITPDVSTRKPKTTTPGQGTALGDIPYVREAFDKFRGATLQGLFRLCFGRVGGRHTWKKELRKFSGFPFDEKAVQFQRKKAVAQKLAVSELKNISSILGTERAHTKNEMVTNILAFLLKPTDLGKSPGTLVKRKTPKKRKHQTKKGDKKGGKREPKAKKQKKSKETDLSEESESDSSGEEEEGDGEGAHENKVAAVKKESRKGGDAANKKATSKGDESKIENEESMWGAGGPTDVELNDEINMLLHTMDLSQATMKEMCVEIASKFPNLNMSKYKGAIKQRIKAALDKLDA
uniref:DEK C-terminal domain-containing protein n=1 Tax=Parascaris univalens TaxID=6257 RepID=A0A915AC86_PARUN